MNAYELDIRAMKNPRMADIINTARKHISSSYLKLYPWAHSELNHGKGYSSAMMPLTATSWRMASCTWQRCAAFCMAVHWKT